jgi:hypothetical protein
VPVVRIISTGATVIGGAVKDYNNGNFDNTIKNSVQIIAPSYKFLYFLLILFLHLYPFLPHSVISLA